MMCLFHEKILILGIAFFGTPGMNITPPPSKTIDVSAENDLKKQKIKMAENKQIIPGVPKKAIPKINIFS